MPAEHHEEPEEAQHEIVLSSKRAYTLDALELLSDVVVLDNVAYSNAGNTVNRTLTSCVNRGTIISRFKCPGRDTAECAVMIHKLSILYFIAEMMAYSVDIYLKFDGMVSPHVATLTLVNHRHWSGKRPALLGYEGWWIRCQEQRALE